MGTSNAQQKRKENPNSRKTMKTITVNGRSALLDLEDVTPAQGALLAETLAKVLVKTGGLADGARLTGPHLIQFAEEFVEHG